MFLHPYYVKYHVQCSLWFLTFDKFLLFDKTESKEQNKVTVSLSNYTVTGLTGQVIVLHIYHLKYLHTYYKLALKMCMSLNYVHNTHCKFLKIQVASMQETATRKSSVFTIL